MRALIILPLCILLVSAGSQKKESKAKTIGKKDDLDAQPSRRAYSSVQSSASSYGKTATYGSPGFHGSSLSSPNLLTSSYGSSSPHLPSRPQLPSSPFGSSGPHLPSSPQLPSSPLAASGPYGPSSSHSSYGSSNSNRPLGSYGSSHSYGSPPKEEYGLVHEYPQAGPGKLDPTADSHREPLGGHRKGVEHSSPYGYGGFNNRGPALPNSHTGPSSFSGSSYGSGPSPVHDSYSKPVSGYTSNLNRPTSGYNQLSHTNPSSGGYAQPISSYGGGYGGSSSGYSRPLSGDRYSSGYSKPPPPSGYSKPLPASGYSKPLPAAGYSRPLPSSGYSQSSSGHDGVRQYGAYSAAPPSGHSSTSSLHSPRPYSAPVPKPYGGYSPSSSLSGYAPSSTPHRGYAPPSGGGYSSPVHGGPAPVPHVSYTSSAPSSGYALSSGHNRPQNSYYSSDSHGGYGAPPSSANYPTAYRSSNYGPDGYGKTYGTVTQKEYSKTIESYGSTGGLGGQSYSDGRRAALHADHGIYGAANYGRRYDIEDQPQVHSQDQAIYGGYGHVY